MKSSLLSLKARALIAALALFTASDIIFCMQQALASPALSAGNIVAALTSRVAGLASYSANVSARVRMRSFPFFRATFHGTTSFVRPGRFSVTMNNPTLAGDYQAAFNDMGDPAMWLKVYDVTVDAAQPAAAGLVALRLVPKLPNNIDHTVALVRLATMTVEHIDWFYTNGGRIAIQQQFESVGGLLMVTHQDIDVAMPSAKFSAQADLDGYSLSKDTALK